MCARCCLQVRFETGTTIYFDDSKTKHMCVRCKTAENSDVMFGFLHLIGKWSPRRPQETIALHNLTILELHFVQIESLTEHTILFFHSYAAEAFRMKMSVIKQCCV